MKKRKLGTMEIVAGLVLILGLGIFLFLNKTPDTENNDSTFSEIVGEAEIQEDIVPDLTPISHSQDETISKLWFDLRRTESIDEAKSLMEELSNKVSEMMEEGLLPQVVSSFPLVYVNGNETGFQRDSLYIGEDYYELVTIVGPDLLGLNKVKVLFRRATQVVDLGAVPFLFTNYGVVEDKLILAGDLIDPSSEEFYSLVIIDTNSMKPITPTLVENSKVSFNRDSEFVKVGSSYNNYYFYTEYANEGIKEDPLYLILEGEDYEDYFQYEVDIIDDQLVLVEVYNGADN